MLGRRRKQEQKPKLEQEQRISKVAQATADMNTSPRVEFIFCGMSFPGDQKMLKDPNAWIADNAATVARNSVRKRGGNAQDYSANDAR
jgi:hypothetical protein